MKSREKIRQEPLLECVNAFSPDYYLQRFDLERDIACMRNVTEQELSYAAFLDGMLMTADPAVIPLPIDYLLDCNPAVSPCRYRLILHSA